MDIEPCSTNVERIEYEVADVIEHDEYDNKDMAIEGELDEIVVKALEGYNQFIDMADVGEARFKARMGEVGLQYLKLASDTIGKKASMKEHKDKLVVKKQTAGPKTVNQNVIVDRNDILKMLLADDPDTGKSE